MSLGLSPLEQLEAEKRERETKISKTESEMEQVFETKVKEKRKKLKEMEAEVRRIVYGKVVHVTFSSEEYYSCIAIIQIMSRRD